MIRFLIFLLVPLSLFSKYQVVTYFPLESSIVRKIAQDEVKIREITHREPTAQPPNLDTSIFRL